MVNLLIDGCEPDLARMGTVRRETIEGHTLFIETADPKKLASDALEEVGDQLDEAERLRVEASELLERNSPFKAMEKLSGCFGTWQNAQESVLKTAQLLRIDLSTLLVDNISLTDLLTEFTAQLREIKRALEHRDFVGLNDILRYEATRTTGQWRTALHSLRDRIG